MFRGIWRIAIRHENTFLEDGLGAAALFVMLIAAMHFPY